MAERGVARYNKQTADAVEGGRESDTSYAKRLIPEYVQALADAIQESKQRKNNRGVAAKYIGLLGDIDAQQAAYLTLRYIFDSLINGDTVNNLAINLGHRIEDQIRFSIFEQEHRGYYRRIIEDFKNKGTTNYRHMHRVLTNKAMEENVTWVRWKPEERLHLGVKLLELCIESTGLIAKATHFVSPQKTEVRVVATPETLAWITAHKEHAELLHPENMPCVIPPCDWVSLFDGGYYTPEIRSKVPFVKIKSKAHRKAIKDVDFSLPMKSVNAIQKTAWAVNQDVHAVIKQVWKLNLRIGMPASEPLVIPPSPIPQELKKEDLTDAQRLAFMQWKRAASRTYTAERERFSKCLQLSRVLQMAEKFRDYKEFYYVYNCDFRGRIYCASPGLSPQGADFSKGLLRFAHGKPLGERGAYWLAVHGANTFGYDKASYDDRRAWVEQNEAAVLAVAADPLDGRCRSFWADADKPWQFLAFCFEWAQYKTVGESFESRLAVALDGSCNGLQNFSAMLRDDVGAMATNLSPTAKPQDIYQRVADVCTARLQAILDNPVAPAPEDLDAHVAKLIFAKQWLEFKVTRKCTKRPVMTLPYGSTRQSCREYVEDYILENIERSPWTAHRAIFDASLFLSCILWDSIGVVVVAARNAMDWLQSTSRELSRENIPLEWYSPTGFKVYQGTMVNSSHRVKTQLCGYCYLTVASPTTKVDGRKQALGVAPNFVHSMDASHLVITVDHAPEVTAWAMIHDSYGTYAADTPLLSRAIRTAFVEMYTQHDVLTAFKEQAGRALDLKYEEAVSSNKLETQARLEKLVLPEMPVPGSFALPEVLDSLYFFG